MNNRLAPVSGLKQTYAILSPESAKGFSDICISSSFATVIHGPALYTPTDLMSRTRFRTTKEG